MLLRSQRMSFSHLLTLRVLGFEQRSPLSYVTGRDENLHLANCKKLVVLLRNNGWFRRGLRINDASKSRRNTRIIEKQKN